MKNISLVAKAQHEKPMTYGQTDEEKPVFSIWPISPHQVAS